MILNMKRFLYILTLSIAVLSGCKKESLPADEICGEWESTDQSTGIHIYLSFKAGGTFRLYQSSRGMGYEVYCGRWSRKNGVLSGRYNDGEAWAYSYKTSIEGDILTMETVEQDSKTTGFKACLIPEIVKNNATVAVKSRGDIRFPFL